MVLVLAGANGFFVTGKDGDLGSTIFLLGEVRIEGRGLETKAA